jgi:hypothetical protein
VGQPAVSVLAWARIRTPADRLLNAVDNDFGQMWQQIQETSMIAPAMHYTMDR